MRTGRFTVPTVERKWDVELWVGGVESGVWCSNDAGFAGIRFATERECPQFAQGIGKLWKSGLAGARLRERTAWIPS